MTIGAMTGGLLMVISFPVFLLEKNSGIYHFFYFSNISKNK